MGIRRLPLTSGLAAGLVFMSNTLAATLTGVGTASAAVTEPSKPGYLRAPEVIRRALDAPALPSVALDPSRRVMALMDRELYPPIEDLAAPMVRLAGSRIDPASNGPHGPRQLTGLTLRRIDGSTFASGAAEVRVRVPADADLSGISWSPDGARFMFTNTRAGGIELWVGDTASGEARAVTGPVLNAAAGSPARWMPDGQRVLVRVVPENRAAAPAPPRVPAGPVIQETRGKSAPVRTFQDLLQTPHDEALFDYYMTSQLEFIDLKSGERTKIGGPAIYTGNDPSPSGEFLLISRTERPYSYLHPWSLFPEVVEVWDTSGKVVREVVRVPLLDTIPIEGVQTGPRSIEWRDTERATLVWAEALDEGDPRKKVAHRDRVMMLAAPFAGEAREVTRTEHRFTGVSWMQDGTAWYTEFDRDRRWARTWLMNPDAAGDACKPRLLFDRSTLDQYKNPGSPLTTRLPSGRSVVRIENGSVFMAGRGATPEGDRPFLDRLSLADFTSERLWRNAGESFESVVDILSADGTRFITQFETPTQYPNYFIRDVRAGGAEGGDGRAALAGAVDAPGGGQWSQITRFEDPVPELRRVKKELVKYRRSDGVELSATMYLPADYQPGTRLPLFVWAYPQEFTDAGVAGQVAGSPRRFTSIGGTSHLFLLTQGYAVMDAATMPIVGHPETANDTFVDQIVSSAQAAIDKAVEMGVADRDRVAVGGHSYGAFMTANLMAHCDLFRAGIARSGAYNRTLTPFGFQGERRTYWEAPDVYERLSPFTFAHKINEPLLLIHGEIDNNPGTFPIQSERLYHAIKGNAGTARLVMLPFESHGYSARESVEHTLAEMIAWLDRWVKNAPPRSPGEAQPAASAAPGGGDAVTR